MVRKQTQLIYGMAGGKDNFVKYWPIEDIDEKQPVMTKKKLSNIFNKLKAKELERRKLAANN